MRHVWILNHYAQLPSDNGGLLRHHSLARHLPRYGWSASIIASGTEHPSGRRRETGTAGRLGQVDGIPFLSIPTPGYAGNGPDRIWNMLAYAWRAVTPGAVAGLPSPDAVIGSSPHPGAALAGALLARRYRVPFIFEVRDLWPQALIDMNRLRTNGVTAQAMRLLEKQLFRRSKRSITLWPNVSAYLKDRGIEVPEPVWISNGVDIAGTPEPKPRGERSDEFVLMYLGAHGGANGLENLVQAMKIIEGRRLNRPIRLRLIGDGPQKPKLQRLVTSLGLTSVVFESSVPKGSVPALAAEADAFIFNLIDVPLFRYGISPNKLYDYMAAARPVIFCCRSFNNPIAESGGGISVPPGSPACLADGILTLFALSAAERAAMGTAARRYVERHHDLLMLAGDLARVLDDSLTV